MDQNTSEHTVLDQPARKPYTKPAITDHGSLQELTAHHTTAGTTDVPLGTAGPQVFS